MRVPLLLFYFNIILFTSSKAQYGYFYTGKDFGTEAIVSPVSSILNGGFDVVQASSISNRFSDMGLNKGFESVSYSLRHPIKSINEVGWKTFLNSEILPLGLEESGDNWMPNYSLHVLGGGVVYATMADYYNMKNYKYPRFFAGLTVMSYHFLNEVVEKNFKGKGHHDAVADLYFFDPLGILLFSSKSVQYFFSHEVIMRDWSSQASFRFIDGSIRNTGQNFLLRWKPYFKNQPVSLFGFLGLGMLGGLGYDFKNYTFSTGVGFKTTDIVTVKNNERLETIEVSPSIGFFIDKENSLLASFVHHTHQLQGENFKFEIFPGVIPLKKVKIGFWASENYGNQYFYGISFGWTPGISI
tara:strand:- start:44848 stop:45912 length:1065 start_codon:yes stop_codon:yes gene_type:complete